MRGYHAQPKSPAAIEVTMMYCGVIFLFMHTDDIRAGGKPIARQCQDYTLRLDLYNFVHFLPTTPMAELLR